MATLDEGVGVVRVDRDAKLSEAIKLFSELKQKRSSSPSKSFLGSAETQAALSKVIELAPNHQSAKHLLANAKGQALKSLSANASLYHLFTAMYPYREVLFGDKTLGKGSLLESTIPTTRKRLNQLRPIADKQIQPLLREFTKFVDICDRLNEGRGNPADLVAQRRAIASRLQDLSANREMMEKLIREGF